MYIISFTFFYSTRFLAFASFLRWCYYNKQVYQLISLNQQKKLAQKMFSYQRNNLRVCIKFQHIAYLNIFDEYNGFIFIIAWFTQIWIIYNLLITFWSYYYQAYYLYWKLHVIFLRPKFPKFNTRKTILTMYVTSSKFAPMQLKGIPTSMQNDVIFCKAVFKPILKAALLFAD